MSKSSVRKGGPEPMEVALDNGNILKKEHVHFDLSDNSQTMVVLNEEKQEQGVELGNIKLVDSMDDEVGRDFVFIPSTKYHLSDVNLLNGDLTKEELEIKHSRADHEAIAALASQVFDGWNFHKDGIISVPEIQASGLDEHFAAALGRVMEVGGKGGIDLEDVTNCLTILKFGTMKAKVALLVEFMDRDGDHQISYDEASMFLKAAPYEICRKLGLIGDLEVNKCLEYEDILRLFELSDRGEEAIDVFCGHILGILKSKIRGPQSRLHAVSHLCFGLTDIKRIMRNTASRLRHTPRSSYFLAALLALQAALWELNFSYYQEQGKPYPFCVAKGFGLNLRILTILLFLSMARSTMGFLFDFKLVRNLVPMGFNIQVHSFMGFCLVFHAIGHMAGHIVYHNSHVEGGFGHAFVQKSLIRGFAWAEIGSGDAITGYMLLFMLLAMAGTALNRSNGSLGYKVFSSTHFFYVLWLGVLVLHVPRLWPWFLAIGALFSLERAYDFFKLTTHSTLASSRPCGNNVTFLSVPRASLPCSPGSYFRIKVGDISQVEWHPFSLAGSVSSHHLTFFVAAAGDWTQKLYDIVSDPSLRERTSIQVQGPFYAPARSAVKSVSKRTMLVASGIGITPFFSVMATRVAEEASYQADKEVYVSLFNESLNSRGKSTSTIKGIKNFAKLKSDPEAAVGEDGVEALHVIWSIRDVSELMFYLDYVYELVKHQNNLEKPAVIVDVYLTGIGKKTDLGYMMTQTLFLLTMGSKTSKYMKVHFVRPDLNAILDDVQPDRVYYCGGKVLKDMLSDCCIERNISFHPEDFDSGANFVRDKVSLVKKVFSDRADKKEADRHRSARLQRPPVVEANSGVALVSAVEVAKEPEPEPAPAPAGVQKELEKTEDDDDDKV